MYTNLKVNLVKSDDTTSNFFCKICNYVLITQKDFLCDKEYNCCSECYLQFVESRKEEWKKGYKIDKIELSKYLNIRKQLNEKIINITGE